MAVFAVRFVWSTAGSTPAPSSFWAVRYKVYKVAVNHLRLRTAGSIPALPTISPTRASLVNQPSFIGPPTTPDGVIRTRRWLNFTGWDFALVCLGGIVCPRFVWSIVGSTPTPSTNLERWQSGLSQHPAKVLNLYWVSRVRIPPSPHLDPIVQWTEPAASIRLIQVRLLFGSPPSGPLAQWLEPAAHNSQGAGSSPAGPIFRRREPVRLTNDSRCLDRLGPIFWQDQSRAPKAPCSRR